MRFPAVVRGSSLDRHTLCGGLAIVLWSTTIALVRSLSEQLGPLTAAAAVYLVGGGLSLVAGRGTARFRSLPRLYLLGCGGLFVLNMISLTQAIGLSVDRVQVLEIGMVNYLWPSLTILFSLVLLQGRARWLLLPGTALALAGVFLVLTQGAEVSWTSLAHHLAGNPPAYLLGLVAAVSWALYSNLTRRWSPVGSGGGASLFMLATAGLLLALRLGASEETVWTFKAMAEVLFLGTATATAYVCWERAMRHGDVVLVAACSYFTPLLSTLVSCLYLGITAGVQLWLGAAAIVCGSLMSWAAVSGPEGSTTMKPVPATDAPTDR